MRRLIMLLLILGAVPYMASAAEVKNLKVSQIGDNAVATYDLVGGAGEQDAEVTVVITIGNERRTSDKLSLTGDFGKGVKVGTGKKIVWNVMKDIPANFDFENGELSWDVKATVPAVPLAWGSRFTLRDGVIDDSELGLQWAPANGQVMNHYQAEEYARNLSLGGGGWRLPTRAELKSLYEESAPGHVYPVFNVTDMWVWTSDVDAANSSLAWDFYFRSGDEGRGDRDVSGSRRDRVLAVRSQR